jgi:cytochrome bd-type quinol oxidase subunit 1
MVGQYFRMAVMGFFVYGFSSYYLDQGSRSTVTDRSNAALEILACTVLVVFIIHGQAALRWSSKHFYDKQQRR